MGEVVGQLREIFPEAILVSATNVFELGDETGAYALMIDLLEPVIFGREALGLAELQGSLIYVGSAYGPGGMKARLIRHFKQDKSIRWHVDELTTRAEGISALAIAGGNECEIVSKLTALDGFQPAMQGFGSSDCSVCAAHLLAYNAD